MMVEASNEKRRRLLPTTVHPKPKRRVLFLYGCRQGNDLSVEGGGNRMREKLHLVILK